MNAMFLVCNFPSRCAERQPMPVYNLLIGGISFVLTKFEKHTHDGENDLLPHLTSYMFGYAEELR